MLDMHWIDSIGASRRGEVLVAARRPRRSPEHGPPPLVAQIEFDFRQWDGPIGEWSEHFGKGRGQVYSLDGGEPLRSCQEVEVAKRLRVARDHAFWFSGYSVARVPSIWRPWVSSLAEAPDWLVSLDRPIRQRIASRKGGMPDVVAWDDLDPLGSAIFIECKGPRETFKPAQEDWLWAALRAGVRRPQIAVAIRTF
jgi:VRR-NUC domain